MTLEIDQLIEIKYFHERSIERLVDKLDKLDNLAYLSKLDKLDKVSDKLENLSKLDVSAHNVTRRPQYQWPS